MVFDVNCPGGPSNEAAFASAPTVGVSSRLFFVFVGGSFRGPSRQCDFWRRGHSRLGWVWRLRL
eukprot:7130684-Pyramimonas_sp.AAC.1